LYYYEATAHTAIQFADSLKCNRRCQEGAIYNSCSAHPVPEIDPDPIAAGKGRARGKGLERKGNKITRERGWRG